MIIKNSIKGPKVHSVFHFINACIANNNQEIINNLVSIYLLIQEQENFVDYINYALNKDLNLRKMYPKITEFIEKKLN